MNKLNLTTLIANRELREAVKTINRAFPGYAVEIVPVDADAPTTAITKERRTKHSEVIQSIKAAAAGDPVTVDQIMKKTGHTRPSVLRVLEKFASSFNQMDEGGVMHYWLKGDSNESSDLFSEETPAE